MKIPGSRVKIGVLLIILIALAACRPSGGTSSIEIDQAWTRAVGAQVGMESSLGNPANQGESSGINGAVYMVIRNRGSETDRLLRVESGAAEHVELHQSEVKDDVIRMHPVEAVEVPAGGQVELMPGGYHVMMINLKQALVPGETIRLKLFFERAGEIEIEAEVREP